MPSGSYGDAFNDAQGGVYAVWLESDFLNIYWFPRSRIPADITAGNPRPSSWGRPTSTFVSNSGCNVGDYFKDQTIVSDLSIGYESKANRPKIINTDFCGDNFSGSIWDDTCAADTAHATCDEYVTNNPQDFAGAYWMFNSIKLYQ
jgi:hypothetical protein